MTHPTVSALLIFSWPFTDECQDRAAGKNRLARILRMTRSMGEKECAVVPVSTRKAGP